MPVCVAAAASAGVNDRGRMSSNRNQKNRALFKSQVAGYADKPAPKEMRKKQSMHKLPSIDRRIYSGLFRKKVFYGKGEQWQRHLAVLTVDILAFSTFDGTHLLSLFPEEFHDTIEMTRAKFDEHDVDKSGCLSWEEIKKSLSDLNLQNSDARVLLLLNDKDSSHSLDWEEFQLFLSQAVWSKRLIDHVPLNEIVNVSDEIFSKEEAQHRKSWLVSDYQSRITDNSTHSVCPCRRRHRHGKNMRG
jgi:hypothetical protein